ncbi:MAG: 2-oxoacid:acceptor oxidoreductase family protein [Thermofilum sp.]|jgi:pyruvate ferredoxin oxidoreductase gamma subunit|nr:2-oxoacid:acceptor oxidoreductase family protein [Thermofilum sp.]
MEPVFDVIWLGRGGQGAVTAATLLAEALIRSGKYALAIPFFGAERRGAPVFAYNRISSERILSRARVTSADLVAILDPTLLATFKVEAFLKQGGKIVVNSAGRKVSLPSGVETYCLDAVSVAESLGLRLAGIVLVNMPMLGAVARAYGGLDFSHVEGAVKGLIKSHVEENVEAVKKGWEDVRKCS